MGFPMNVDRLVWNCPFCILMGCQSKFLSNDVFLSLKIVFISAISADPNKMSPYMAFHLGLHGLPNYQFNSIQNEKC